jgi:myo-inositol-1(or 4)-monophosphatase
VTGWPYNRELYPETFKTLSRFSLACQEIRAIGCASLSLCYVASGFFDGYWEWGLGPWDMAGGAVIALEAGCRLSRLNGEEFQVRGHEVLVANPEIHAQMIDVLHSEGSQVQPPRH